MDCARTAVQDLDGKGVLLVGAGKMSKLAARPSARRRGADHDHLAWRVERAAWREAIGGEPVALDGLAEVADQVDVIIASTDSADASCSTPGPR